MNKIQRVSAAFKGEKPDRVPVAFWFPYYPIDNPKELAKLQLDLYRQTDMDLIKITYDLRYALEEQIHTPTDWYHIKPLGKKSKYFQKQCEVIKEILDQTQGECMTFTTLFGAMRSEVWSIDNKDEVMMAHYKENPHRCV